MATCIKCGKDLGFFKSLLGKKMCKECEEAENLAIAQQRAKMLAEYHMFFEKNLKATSIDQLEEWKNFETAFPGIHSLANSMKSDEIVYIACSAKAKKSKYMGFRRFGLSAPVFGLKGFRMYIGQSIPTYQMVDVALGALVITNKNIHLFTSWGNPMKIPYKKVEGFHIYDDGMELYHGLQKPIFFVFGLVNSMQRDVIGHIIGLFTQ